MERIGKLTCKIMVYDKIEMGFLVSLTVQSSDSILCGLMTNNIILPSELLQNDCIIYCCFEIAKENHPFNFKMTPDRFRFTDPLLNCTFIQIDAHELKVIDIEFLSIDESCDIEQEVIITQHIEGGSLFFADGLILKKYGVEFLYSGESRFDSSGCALCTVNGDVAGVNTYNNAETLRGVATNIYYIQKAIDILHQNPDVSPKGSYEMARTLSGEEREELRKHGLEGTSSPHVFVSPWSMDASPLWFFRSNHAWYWTPESPKDFSQRELSRCNWMVISDREPIESIGHWDKERPAEKNISLIRWLISTELRFLQ